MTTGYARLYVNGVFHKWGLFMLNPFYLRAICDRGSLLPAAGAKFKQRDELPEGARVCSWCERKETR